MIGLCAIRTEKKATTSKDLYLQKAATVNRSYEHGRYFMDHNFAVWASVSPPYLSLSSIVYVNVVEGLAKTE